MSNYDATNGEQGWIMKSKLNELRLEAGISRLHDEPKFMVAVSKEGTVMEPLDGLEKFAEAIVQECIDALWTEECHTSDLAVEDYNRNCRKIKQHFGVK